MKLLRRDRLARIGGCEISGLQAQRGLLRTLAAELLSAASLSSKKCLTSILSTLGMPGNGSSFPRKQTCPPPRADRARDGGSIWWPVCCGADGVGGHCAACLARNNLRHDGLWRDWFLFGDRSPSGSFLRRTGRRRP